MALFRFLWLRRYVRQRMNPIPTRVARTWEQRFSFLYMILAWNVAGLIGYQYYKGKGDLGVDTRSDVEKSMSPATSFALMFKVDQAKIVRLGMSEGFSVREFKREDYVDPAERAAENFDEDKSDEVNEDDDDDDEENNWNEN